MATRKTAKDLELKPEDLEGFDMKDLKCHACSGYGSCGYRTYRLLDGKPVLLCQLRKQQLTEERDQKRANSSE